MTDNILDEIEVTLTLSAGDTAGVLNALEALYRKHGLEEHKELKKAIEPQLAEAVQSYDGGSSE